jgi:hypothetical protein
MLQINQQALLDGLLLGDGSIDVTGRFSISQSGDHRAWIPVLAQQFESFGVRVAVSTAMGGFVTIKGKRCLRKPRSVLRTRRISWLKEQRQRWYPNDTKHIPRDVSVEAEALAAWLCGDGVCAGNGYRIEFCTDSFPATENRRLMRKLFRTYGWVLGLTDRNRIRLCRQEERTALRDLVKPYILPEFEHKIAIKEKSSYYRLDDLLREKMRKLRFQGYSIDDLSDEFHMSRSGVYSALKKMNLTGKRIPRRWQKKPNTNR